MIDIPPTADETQDDSVEAYNVTQGLLMRMVITDTDKHPEIQLEAQ